MYARLRSVLLSTYLRKRLLTAVAAFAVVYVLNFIIPHLEPGNFVTTLAGQADLFPAQKAQLEALFGVNQPLSTQFIQYVHETILTFPPTFGISFAYYPFSVWKVISVYLPGTLFLILLSQAIAWPTGVLIGAYLAWNQGSKADSVMTAISTFLWGMPAYWLAGVLILIFAIRIHLFPAALAGFSFSGGFLQTGHVLWQLGLPVMTLVLLNMPQYAMVMRNTMIDVKQEDFIFAATARGLRYRTLIFSQAARSALLPSITNLALAFGSVLSGAYLVEVTFSYPGMGYLIVQSAFDRDLPVLQGVFFISAILVILANVLADIAYTILDPRI